MKPRIIAGVFAALMASPCLAQAQAVTFADLEGRTVTAYFVYAQNVRLLDQGRTINNESRTTMTLAIGPGSRIAQDFRIQVVAPNGREINSPVGKIEAELNKPTRWRHGEMVFVFENESLIRLQTFNKGGRKITISFKRSPSGLTCRVEAPFSKEEGAGGGGVDTTSQTTRERIEILSAKTSASSCRVAKTGG